MKQVVLPVSVRDRKRLSNVFEPANPRQGNLSWSIFVSGGEAVAIGGVLSTERLYL